MIFSKPITDLIKERTSRRTFKIKLIEPNIKEDLIKILELKNLESPFNRYAINSRFELIKITEWNPKEQKKIGTYGLIKGAQEFIAGTIEKKEHNREQYGYLMEYIILAATDMGLGTCWLGGFFNRSLFAEKIGSLANEIIPAITPIGYSEKRRTKEVVIRQYVKADKRYPWDRLFYQGDFSTPMSLDIDDNFKTLLRMVQIGPSAGNKQPWRIVKELEKNNYHFYTETTKGIYQSFHPLDIGIAICHWDLTSQELGVKGKWEINQPNIPGSNDFDYTITWKGE